MNTVTDICKNREFNIEQAEGMIPILKSIIKKHEAVIKKIMADQRYFIKTKASDIRIKECDNLVGKQMAKCGAKVHKLGVKVFGDGYFGFDSGMFYWSWKYPENRIDYYCGYYDNPRFSRYPIKVSPSEVYD